MIRKRQGYLTGWGFGPAAGRKRRDHSMFSEKGITLTEIIVVVAIIGIIAALAVPNFMEWLPRLRTNSAARELTTDFVFARTSSIKEGVCYTITIRTDTNVYEVRNPNTIVKTVTLPIGIVFGAPAGALVNFPAPYDFFPSATYSSSCSFCGGTPTGTASFSPNGQLVATCSPGSQPIDGTVSLCPQDDITPNRLDRVKRIAVIGLTGSLKLF